MALKVAMRYHCNFRWERSETVRMVCMFHEIPLFLSVGDGRQGHPEDAPYNAIHVGAATPTLPEVVSC